MVIWACLGAALAQAPDPDPGGVSEEVIVYEELLVRQAREKVIEQLQQEGFTRIVEKDDAVVLRHEKPWGGEVWLHDDGWMRVKRQPVRFEAPATPWGKTNSAGAWMGCILYPFLCVRPGGQVLSKRKQLGVETQTVDAVQSDVEVWSDRVADLAVDRKVDALPDRLTRLWEEGAPLEPGGNVLTTPEARKQALLTFWETRTDTPWGEEVRRGVEAFLRGVVQHSDHPITPEELAAFNQRSHAGRALDLERRPVDDEGAP